MDLTAAINHKAMEVVHDEAEDLLVKYITLVGGEMKAGEKNTTISSEIMTCLRTSSAKTQEKLEQITDAVKDDGPPGHAQEN
ncbi:hypothetical protein PRZ48_002430 [Zasmidium cellare]|uniref:Uncharacterized protein n=1 Tax=Zasmidium cellare TaxID=395010 RepID=A0ABR0F627_ZASCE|nr:hypothetical protein PRZ48_002430 [Zasmidium cellare]